MLVKQGKTTVELKQVQVNGASLACLDIVVGASIGATANPMPTLLLVHGFPLSHAMWLPVIKQLEQTVSQPCRVIAPDLRGYGESTLGDTSSAQSASQPISKPVSLADYADDLQQLLIALNVTNGVVFVGFSMGGYIAWPFMERHPSLLTALVLADTRAGDDTEPARATRLKMADKVAEWGAGRIAELMRPNLFAAGTADEIVESTVRVIALTAPATIAASQRAMAARPDNTPNLPNISVRTQVIVGEEDAISTVEEMQGMAAAVPNAEFTVIEGAGHMSPVERPRAFAQALADFVTQIS